MAAVDFWSNRERAQADVEEVSRLRSLINPFQQLEREIEDFSVLQQLAAEESDPAGRAHAEKEVATEHDRLVHKLEEFELCQFFSGENDRANAFFHTRSKCDGDSIADRCRARHSFYLWAESSPDFLRTAAPEIERALDNQLH